MTSVEKTADDEAEKEAGRKTVEAARGLAKTMGVGDLFMGPDEQPPSSNADWDRWRAMPQTRRLMSWLIERVVNNRNRIATLSDEMVADAKHGRVGMAAQNAASIAMSHEREDAYDYTLSAIRDSHGNANPAVKLSPEQQGIVEEARRKASEIWNAALEQAAKEAV